MPQINGARLTAQRSAACRAWILLHFGFTLRAARRLQRFVRPFSKRGCLLTIDEFCNCCYQPPRYNHDGLAPRLECCFILGDRFVLSLLLIMLEHGPDSRFVPPCWKPILACHLFLSYPPSICFQRFPAQFVCRNDEHAVWFRISYIYYAQISSRVGLPDGYSGIVTARTVFAAACQSFLDFVLVYGVVVNVRQTRNWIDIESQVHVASIGCRSRVDNVETDSTLSAERSRMSRAPSLFRGASAPFA